MKKSIVSFVLLIVTALLLAGCILPPLPGGGPDGGGHRGGGHGGGHNDGGRR